MTPFISASNSGEVQALVDRYLRLPMVQGFAVGIDELFVAFYRGEFGREASQDEQVSGGKIPSQWIRYLSQAGLPPSVSPIQVFIYVDQDPFRFGADFQVPTFAGNYRVFIERRGPLVGLSNIGRQRPVKAGYSVGNAGLGNSGTIGGFLRLTEDFPFLVSCNHVLDGGGSLDVLQPGSGDGGSVKTDVVAGVSQIVPLNLPAGFTLSSPYEKIDAGIARVTVPINTHPRLLLKPVKQISAVATIAPGDDVQFVGKESDLQHAIVNRLISRVKVKLTTVRGTATYLFGDVFEIKSKLAKHSGALTVGGDSGAWVLHDADPSSYTGFGMVFAGDPSMPDYATCCFLETVIDELRTITGTSFDVY